MKWTVSFLLCALFGNAYSLKFSYNDCFEPGMSNSVKCKKEQEMRGYSYNMAAHSCEERLWTNACPEARTSNFFSTHEYCKQYSSKFCLKKRGKLPTFYKSDCKLRPTVSNCRKRKRVYYYNPGSKSCVKSYYGGCTPRTRNYFKTRQLCHIVAHPVCWDLKRNR